MEALWSNPLPCSEDSEHTLALTFGSLYPPGGDADSLRNRLLFHLDGIPILTGIAPGSAAKFGALAIGKLIAGTTGAQPFSGEVESVRQIDVRLFSERSGGAYFGSHHGPVELIVRFPKDAIGRSEPLVITGRTGAADMLSVTYVDDRRVRFALDHWGTPGLQSNLIAIEPGAVQCLIVSLGSLFPEQHDSRYTRAPGARILREWHVRLNDHVVFSQPFHFFRLPPTTSFSHETPSAARRLARCLRAKSSNSIVGLQKLSAFPSSNSHGP